MKTVKVAAIGIGVLVALAIVAAVTLVALFDPNDYKGYVTDRFAASTGRQLVIADDLELSVFPWLAVETGGITLGNAPGFDGTSFATIGRVSARVRLMPLLGGRIEIGRVRIDRLELDLATTADGRTNWDDLLAAVSPQPEDGAAAPAQTTSLGDLDIEAIELRDARIVWRENTTETRYVASELNLETGRIVPGRPLPIELALNVLDSVSQQSGSLESSATVLLRADGGVDLSELGLAGTWRDAQARERGKARMTLASLTVPAGGAIVARGGEVTTSLVDAPVGPPELETTASWDELTVDPTTFAVAAPALRIAVGGIGSTWQITSEPAGGAAAIVRGSVTGEGPAAELLALLAAEPPAGVTAAELGDFRASGSFTFDTAAQRLEMRDSSASVLDISVRLSELTSDTAATRARIELAPVRLSDVTRRVLAAYVPEEIDLSALGRVGFRGNVSLRSGQTAVSGLEAELFGASLTGEINFSADGSVVAGTIATNRFAPAELLAVGRAYLTESIDAATAGTFALATSFRYDSNAGSARLEQLRLEAFGLTASGELAASDLSRNPTYTGRASLAGFDPRDVLGRFGMPIPQTSDEQALRRASVEGTFRITPDAGTFENLVVALDESRITGSLTVSNFSDPSYAFDLRADTLNVDRYLPPASEEAAAEERTVGDIELSNEQLSALRVDGAAQVGALRLAGLDFQNVATRLQVGDGKLQLDSAQANLYGGSFNGRLVADATTATPSLLLLGRTAGVELEPLLTALVADGSFSGTANFDIDLQGHGATLTENLQSAAGTMGFALTNGAIDGFNIDEMLCTQYNQIAEQPAPGENPADRTPYQAIRGTAMVADGVAHSSDLFAQAGSFEIRGNGSLTLADGMTDYRFDARLARSVPIRGCETMDHMMNIDFPLVMTGPITAPEPRPDYSEVVKRVIEDRIRDRIEDRLQDRLRDLLR